MSADIAEPHTIGAYLGKFNDRFTQSGYIKMRESHKLVFYDIVTHAVMRSLVLLMTVLFSALILNGYFSNTAYVLLPTDNLCSGPFVNNETDQRICLYDVDQALSEVRVKYGEFEHWKLIVLALVGPGVAFFYFGGFATLIHFVLQLRCLFDPNFRHLVHGLEMICVHIPRYLWTVCGFVTYILFVVSLYDGGERNWQIIFIPLYIAAGLDLVLAFISVGLRMAGGKKWALETYINRMILDLDGSHIKDNDKTKYAVQFTTAPSVYGSRT